DYAIRRGPDGIRFRPTHHAGHPGRAVQAGNPSRGEDHLRPSHPGRHPRLREGRGRAGLRPLHRRGRPGGPPGRDRRRTHPQTGHRRTLGRRLPARHGRPLVHGADAGGHPRGNRRHRFRRGQERRLPGGPDPGPGRYRAGRAAAVGTGRKRPLGTDQGRGATAQTAGL
ncbi:MAG: N5-carboxyaminoimidazole ribonucleotide mutase (EC 5.4.99.18), partial [Olavius algarvensis Gamma 1 endosymbiont]